MRFYAAKPPVKRAENSCLSTGRQVALSSVHIPGEVCGVGRPVRHMGVGRLRTGGKRGHTAPSLPKERSWYPPPGAMMMAAPEPFLTRNGVSVGLETLNT